MVYYSKLPSIEEPKTGIIQYLFSNKYNVPDDKPMLIDALDTSRFITYSQLKDQILRFGAGLQDICGFKNDDVLAIFSNSQYDYSIPFFGAIAANGATATINPNYTVEELTYELNQVKAKVIICQKDNIQVALDAGKRTGIEKKNIFIFGEKEVQGFLPFKTALIKTRKIDLKELTYEQAKDKVAAICFSLGNTGKSKGVMITHGNLTAHGAQYEVIDGRFLNPEKDRMIGAVPMFQILGLVLLLNNALYFGIPVFVLPRFNLKQFCQTVQDSQITLAIIIPAICLLLAKDNTIYNYDMSSLKIATSGGSLLNKDITRKAISRLPNLVIRQGFGMAETTLLSTCQKLNDVIEGSVGFLASNMSMKIVDDDGNEVKQGERGELWVKGPNIMKGYINNPKATAECIDSDNYFHTGDIGIIGANGHFYIVDTKKELIKYKGFQVPPAELEDILLKFPAIADCAVIGIYDPTQATDLPIGYVTLKDNIVASEEIKREILSYVLNQVAHYKKLHDIRFINAIPRGPSGKILRRVLKDIAKQEKPTANSKL